MNQKITTKQKGKDLGICVDNRLLLRDHVDLKIKTANQILGLIKRSFSQLDKEMFLILYKSLV